MTASFLPAFPLSRGLFPSRYALYASEVCCSPALPRATAQYSTAPRPAPTNQENGEIALNAGTRATTVATTAEIAKTTTARRWMPPWYQYGEASPSR